jgi:hypothetical protein
MPKDRSDAASEQAPQLLLSRDEQASNRRKKIHPSPQLVDWLHSPSTADPHTGAQGNTDQSGVAERPKKMKESLEAFDGKWKKMCAANNK